MAAKPIPEEIEAFCARGPLDPDAADPDELWCAAAISPDGTSYWGYGRTSTDAKAFAWMHSYYRDGIAPGSPVEVSAQVPHGWTFELYSPPKSQPREFAIPFPAIFDLVRQSLPDLTLEDVDDAIKQSFPYLGSRQA
jgi:hypothetical protein